MSMPKRTRTICQKGTRRRSAFTVPWPSTSKRKTTQWRNPTEKMKTLPRSRKATTIISQSLRMVMTKIRNRRTELNRNWSIVPGNIPKWTDRKHGVFPAHRQKPDCKPFLGCKRTIRSALWTSCAGSQMSIPRASARLEPVAALLRRSSSAPLILARRLPSPQSWSPQRCRAVAATSRAFHATPYLLLQPLEEQPGKEAVNRDHDITVGVAQVKAVGCADQPFSETPGKRRQLPPF